MPTQSERGARLSAAEQPAFGLIVNECLFPLHPLDLSQEKLKQEKLL